MLKIRCLSTNEVEVRRWQHCYQPDKCAVTPGPSERYFKLTLVSEAEKICALVPVDNWCRLYWPTLSSCSWSLLDKHDLVALFSAEYVDRTFFFGSFKIESLDIVLGSDVNHPWLTITETLLGMVLLASPISCLKVQAVTNALWDSLVLPADWLLGHSYISARLLCSLAMRDVLCIQQLKLQMLVAGSPVAKFKKHEADMLMIEEMSDPKLQQENLPPMQEQIIPDNGLSRFDMAGMTVKLTFVLGQSDIPLKELTQIQPGSIYSIGQGNELAVKVYANKQLVAEGELVYIGDSSELGLEVTRLACLGDMES